MNSTLEERLIALGGRPSGIEKLDSDGVWEVETNSLAAGCEKFYNCLKVINSSHESLAQEKDGKIVRTLGDVITVLLSRGIIPNHKEAIKTALTLQTNETTEIYLGRNEDNKKKNDYLVIEHFYDGQSSNPNKFTIYTATYERNRNIERMRVVEKEEQLAEVQ